MKSSYFGGTCGSELQSLPPIAVDVNVNRDGANLISNNKYRYTTTATVVCCLPPIAIDDITLAVCDSAASQILPLITIDINVFGAYGSALRTPFAIDEFAICR